MRVAKKGKKITKNNLGKTIKGMMKKSSPSVYEKVTGKKNPKWADKIYN